MAGSETIRSRVAGVTGITLPFPVDVESGDGLFVSYASGRAVIRASEKTAIARGYFLLTRMLGEGKDQLEVHEERHFASVGPMLDMSRNGVVRMDRVKAYIDLIATLGLNMLMLYTEDTYEIPEYPLFGALRGRYSQEEMREMDRYAKEAGVELIPCIQTLAHLTTFLRWNQNAPLRDQGDILLIDDEETYKLIEAMLRSLRSCFSSKRIHIGMDEAHGVGFGNYMLRHGIVDRFELLTRHLSRVTALCEKYDFEPMMWSDMFFRLGSKTNNYYDMDVHVPDSVIASLPHCDLVYWDYYHDDEAMYDAMLTEHERMGQKAVFAGGIWTWSGFVPHAEQTMKTMLPALRVATRHRVDTVIATMWGDDGEETDYFLANFFLPLFSETCWQGPDVSEEEISRAGMALTSLPECYPEICRVFYPAPLGTFSGKSLIWADPLLPLMPTAGLDMAEVSCSLGKALKQIEGLPEGEEKEYLSVLYAVASEKARLHAMLRPAYLKSKKDGNRGELSYFNEEYLPMLQAEYHDLMLAHRALWLRDYKPQGWEMLVNRYGALIARLEDAALAISAYVEGKTDTLPELDEEPLPDGANFSYFTSLTTAGAFMRGY